MTRTGTERVAWYYNPLTLLIVVLPMLGCGRPQALSPAETEARRKVEEYCEAVMKSDWKTAYATLDGDSKKKWAAEQFARAADNYRRKLGFPPEKFHIRSCEVQEAKAIARVMYTGHVGTKNQRYADGLILRQTAEGWRIVLPNNFGK